MVMHVNGEPDTAAIINACDEKCARVGFAALSSDERTVCLVNWLRFEVCLGGLSTFYYNSASDYAPEMVRALKELRAPRAAEALGAANAMLKADSNVWLDRVARYEALKQVTDARWRELEEELLSDRPRCYEALLDDYVAMHAAQLPPAGPRA